MGEYKRYTDEQIEQAKNADLVEFVRSHGFDCETVGKEIHVKGYGGLYINPQKNLFTIFLRVRQMVHLKAEKGRWHFARK